MQYCCVRLLHVWISTIKFLFPCVEKQSKRKEHWFQRHCKSSIWVQFYRFHHWFLVTSSCWTRAHAGFRCHSSCLITGRNWEGEGGKNGRIERPCSNSLTSHIKGWNEGRSRLHRHDLRKPAHPPCVRLSRYIILAVESDWWQICFPGI